MNNKKNESFFRILLLYVFTVVGYIVFAKYFTIPVHVGVDEELYISMAKSFHYEGNFAKGNSVLDYTCILYSMILSIAYYFYNPNNIIFFFRIIGICIMLSSIFPAYLLGEKILGDKNKAFKFILIVSVLPSMMSTMYCMQEVLSYPLFLWLIYFVYKEIYLDFIEKISWLTVCIVLLSVLCYFTKTYMIFIPMVYCFLLFVSSNNKKQMMKKMFLVVVMYILLVAVVNRYILYINDGVQGVNHYSSQFANLFPITLETIICAVTCIGFYFAALLFYWGVLTIILPITNWNQHDKKDKYFILFIFCSFFILVIEIVLSIVLTEEGNVIFPRKVLYRYFQILEIPILIIFLKYYKNYKIPSFMWIFYSYVLGMLSIYYVYIGKNQRTSIIDAPIFLLMENINKHIIPYFNVLTCIIVCIFITIVCHFRQKGKLKDILRKFNTVIVVGIGIIFFINLIQLPLYTNVVARGKLIQEDAIKIAEYCEDNKDLYRNIYFIHTPDLFYERAINAYIKQEIIFLTEDEAKNINFKDDIIICSNQYKVEKGRIIFNGLQTVQIYMNY